MLASSGSTDVSESAIGESEISESATRGSRLNNVFDGSCSQRIGSIQRRDFRRVTRETPVTRASR